MARRCFSPELAKSAGLAINRFPQTEDEIAKAENVLAKELEKLTLDEQEKILFEVHGLPRQSLEDDPVALEARLKDVEMELESIKRGREEYDQARAMNPAYVDGRRFRLLCLRSEAYDAKATAELIITHFKVKKKLFGDGEVLARDVCQSDLQPMDLVLVNTGFMQIFPSRDVAGRTVVAVSPEFRNHGTKKTLTGPLRRAFWYLAMTMMHDEETQRKGLVMIVYNYCGYHVQMDLTASSHQLRSAIPQPVEAFHVCSDDPTLRRCVTGVQLFIDRTSRFRLRPHLGTPEANNFELQTFGIPTEDSPMKLDKTWSNAWHLEWLKAQRNREELWQAKCLLLDTTNQAALHPPEEEEIILVPRRFDVLFGKGKQEREHTGNLRASHICDMYRETYETCNKSGKTLLAERIVFMIHQAGGRFLRPKNAGWVEVNDIAAREKIAHFFRFMRGKNKSQDYATNKCVSSNAQSSLDVTEQVDTSAANGMPISTTTILNCTN